MCVCCTHLFSFFPLAFVLVNDLFSGFSLFLETRTFLFLLLFVSCLTRCSFTDVVSCTPTGVSEINDLTCNITIREAKTWCDDIIIRNNSFIAFKVSSWFRSSTRLDLTSMVDWALKPVSFPPFLIHHMHYRLEVG